MGNESPICKNKDIENTVNEDKIEHNYLSKEYKLSQSMKINKHSRESFRESITHQISFINKNPNNTVENPFMIENNTNTKEDASVLDINFSLSRIEQEKKCSFNMNSENYSLLDTNSTSDILEFSLTRKFSSNTDLNFFEQQSDSSFIFNIQSGSQFEACCLTNKSDNKDLTRMKYYSSLIIDKVWRPFDKLNPINSIIIYDWDDTLFATTYLMEKGYLNENEIEICESDYLLLAKLEFCVLRLLTISINTKSDIYIISNSSIEWIESLINKYFPSLEKIIDKIKIISAREQYETEYPGDSNIWKKKAFQNLKKQYDNDSPINILNFGDSLIDIDAGGYLMKLFKESYLKSIKLRESPSITDLIKQLTLSTNQFNNVFKSIKNLIVRVEKR